MLGVECGVVRGFRDKLVVNGKHDFVTGVFDKLHVIDHDIAGNTLAAVMDD